MNTLRQPAAPVPSNSTTTTPSTSQSHSFHHRRSSSRNNVQASPSSTSSSILPSIRRSSSLSVSLRDALPESSIPPTSTSSRATPPPTTIPPRQRRSSLADGIALFREGAANINRWSQSTTSSRASHRDRDRRDPESHHHHLPSFSRKLSISTSGPLSALNTINGPAAVPNSPSRYPAHQSPAASPSRSARPRSPVYDSPPPTVTHPPPKIPSLPPLLLPATVYDPTTPPTASSAGFDTPRTATLFTPGGTAANQQRDYFTSKPTTSSLPSAQRPPSRSKIERVLGKSPLASPAIIGGQESDPRHEPTWAAGRPTTTRRLSITTPKEPVKQPQSAGHPRSASRDHHIRSHSRDHVRSSSRDYHNHLRSESSTSIRLEDSHQGTPPRTRERREKDKKTMLSRALQKANTAVLLDNAQNFEGAVEAYEDACKLLQQVMIRSTQDEDRRKLDAIRVTYTNRIEELRRLDPGYPNASGKSLPARPMSGESLVEQRSMLLEDDEEPAIVQMATMTRIVNDPSVGNPPPRSGTDQLPFRKTDGTNARESVISTAIRDVQKNMQAPSQFHLQPPPGRLADPTTGPVPSPLESPMDRIYMPPPLTPRGSKSPLLTAQQDSHPEDPSRLLRPQSADQQTNSKHQRVHSNESTSWLDTIDESGGSSCSSSVHSLSPDGLRRKHIRNTSGGTEAEFDAALDAAVEAAYDEGYEPFDDDDEERTPADLIATRLRNVELAKERVREAEREEAIAAAKYRYKETQLRSEALPHVRESAELNFDNEAEEEERLLDEMTREYMLDGFDFDLQTKSALPRQSDSSGFSGSTYNSSVSSHRTTGGTSLSTVAEVMHPTAKQAPGHSPPPVPAPSGALPALPSVPESKTSQTNDSDLTPRPSTATKDAASVRSRRLSGQKAKTLKIETSLPPVPAAPQSDKPPVPAKDSPLEIPPVPKTSTTTGPTLDPAFKLPPLPQPTQHGNLAAPMPQAAEASAISPGTPGLGPALSNETGLMPGSPKTGKSSATGIRKNKSSLSLKARNLSISSPDGSDGGSVGTPLSTTFSFTGGRKASNVGLPLATPSIPTFNVDGLPSGGMHLFESDIHSPFSPGSPSPAVTNAPIPLEPCPDSYLLRPFWLMRCFYQTIAHPRGGYLSTKLFIPRDVWRVKGVKIKNVEDKISNLDLLTAALQKLASVDTFDADAILEEMQSLEVVLDQVQTQLAKKLGNEVGVHSVSTLFKEATTVGEGTVASDASGKVSSMGSHDHPKSAVAQGKSYLTSWRKLRSKNSGINLASMASNKGLEVPKDSLVMNTLPMTSLPTIRFAKRDVSSVVFEGPNSNYMSSLARLFDAVQILDQVARQVEDPGLKHSSPTHVGLELSTRHAAEFFGFYICRFVLTDVTLMLDKFIKRGSEWVLV